MLAHQNKCATLFLTSFCDLYKKEGTEYHFFFALLQEEAIAEGVDDEEEMEELRARLAKVRS